LFALVVDLGDRLVTSGNLAECQGLSPSIMAKVFARPEMALRDSQASQFLADAAQVVAWKAPGDFSNNVRNRTDARISARTRGPRTPRAGVPDERTGS